MQPPTDLYDLPPALCVKPLPLIGVSGLDTRNNAIHKSIWETFTSNRRLDGKPVQYKLIDNAYEFPLLKPKRNSYEWYMPKGILKRNWMDKYLNKIPSVVVIFYDLDWNDQLWNEKMIECASRVQSMRVALEGRNTRLTIVLIQNTPPLPSGEDLLASDRAIALCGSCDLHLKSLFILPHGDHLQGYAVRLENAFYELAQSFYHIEARNVKGHRDHLNKNTHQYLFVRHQFKMGFLNELKQETHTAHKHYTHAYNNLLEIRIVDTNAMEIRTVAGFINYKLCRLMFALNLPRDAISQFRAHTDRFKARLGFQELAFEHHAWISKQFNVFGDIFDEAVKLGLPAVQTQHPGLYYQQAVNHAMTRKKTSLELCQNVINYPTPDPLEGLNNLEYYGQRPWRPGKMSGEPPDPQIESNGILALQHIEKQTNHSSIIIALYGLAISQYKTYRCPRTRRHLVVQMADEYYNSQDYGKALTLFTHMLWDYRSETWWTLLSHILEKALKCAYLTANIQDYMLLCLELLASHTTITTNRKKQLYDNLNAILRKQPPKPEIDIPQNGAKNAISLWKQALTTSAFSIDMSNIASCIDCKAKFLKSKYQADENIAVEIYVRNSSEYPLVFSRVSVTINTPGYSSEFAVDEKQSKNPNLLFNSKEIKKFLVEFTPDPNDINKEIQIGSINLHLGNAKDPVVDLKFTGSGNSGGKNCIPPELLHFKMCDVTMPDFNNIHTLSTTLIVPRHSKLSMKFDHPKPALVGEWYQINIALLNEENYDVRSLQCDICLVDDDGIDTTEFSRESSGMPEKLPIVFKMDNLLPGERRETSLYMRAHKVGERNISVKVSFILKSEKEIASLTEDVVHVAVVKPFEIVTKFLSTIFEDIQLFYVGEEFTVMPVVNCLSPWPIVIESTVLEYNSNVKNVDENVKCQISGIELKNNESGAEMYLACTNKRTDVPITIGQYTVKWRRKNGKITTSSQMMITGYTVQWIPLDLEIKIPAHGVVRTPLLVEYKLENKSHHLVQLDVSMEGSEAFMFSGYKQFQTSILPNSSRKLKYNLYPLIAGSVILPKLNLTIPENSTEGPALRQEQLNGLVDRSLPTHIYVMPQMKGDVDVPSIVSTPLTT